MYRLAICEDDPHIKKNLCELCEEILSEMEVEHQSEVFSTVGELEDALIKQEPFHLLLLDIVVGEMNGIEFARELRKKENRISIIFITSHEEYLRDGYSVQPVQFLIKPVKKEALREAIMTDRKQNHCTKAVILQSGTAVRALILADIYYVESCNHVVKVYMEKETGKFKMSLSEMERRLPSRAFCRCHNSYLVNMACVREITRTCVVLNDGTEVPVGRRYYKEVQHRFVEYLNP